jgi:ABC-type transport system substrate-binding protein
VLFGTLPDGLSDLVSKASTTPDGVKRADLYAKANEIIREQVVTVPIAFGSSAVAFKSDVQNAAASPLGNEYFATMKTAGREQLVFVQNVEPAGLYCADEGDFESYRVCSQINETLYGLVPGKTNLRPLLATDCSPSVNAMTWTCALRKDVKFHNGATFDASDVLDSFAAIWDCAHPYHKGRTGSFSYWGFFSNFLNEESCARN